MINKDIAKFLNTEEAMLSGLRSMTPDKTKEICERYQLTLTPQEDKIIRKILSLRSYLDAFSDDLLHVINLYPVQKINWDQKLVNMALISELVPVFEQINDDKNYSLPSIDKDLKKWGIIIPNSYEKNFEKNIKLFRNKLISHLSVDFHKHNFKELGFGTYREYILLYLQAKKHLYDIYRSLGVKYIVYNELEMKLKNRHLRLPVDIYSESSNYFEYFEEHFEELEYIKNNNF